MNFFAYMRLKNSNYEDKNRFDKHLDIQHHPFQHEETIYEFSCDLCEFHSNVQSEIDHHNLSKHEFPCSECDNTYRTPNKLEMHTCKLEVINPEYGSLYTKAWLDGNGCNAVFCRKLSQEIAILHSVKCVSNLKTCCWTPYTVSMKKDSIIHLECDNYTIECHIGYREMLWARLSADTKLSSQHN